MHLRGQDLRKCIFESLDFTFLLPVCKRGIVAVPTPKFVLCQGKGIMDSLAWLVSDNSFWLGGSDSFTSRQKLDCNMRVYDFLEPNICLQGTTRQVQTYVSHFTDLSFRNLQLWAFLETKMFFCIDECFLIFFFPFSVLLPSFRTPWTLKSWWYLGQWRRKSKQVWVCSSQGTNVHPYLCFFSSFQ